MSKSELVLFLAVNLGSVLGQTAWTGSGSGSRPLPQWLTGIIAVVGFLFLTFVVFLIKRAWCEKSKQNIMDLETIKAMENAYESTDGTQRRNSGELTTYTNLALDKFEDKVTSL